MNLTFIDNVSYISCHFHTLELYLLTVEHTYKVTDIGALSKVYREKLNRNMMFIAQIAIQAYSGRMDIQELIESMPNPSRERSLAEIVRDSLKLIETQRDRIIALEDARLNHSHES